MHHATRYLCVLLVLPSCGPDDTSGDVPGGASTDVQASSETQLSVESLVANGAELVRAKRFSAAIIPLSGAFDREPGTERLGERLAECLIESERYEDALDVLARARSVVADSASQDRADSRDRAKLEFLAARALRHLARYPESEVAARRSLDALPRHPASRSLLGQVLALQSKHDEAVVEFRASLSMLEEAGVSSGRDQLHYLLSRSFRALGRQDEAARHLRDFRAIRDRRPEPGAR
jgi:tetratricopeptide (TPR) repeat protein